MCQLDAVQNCLDLKTLRRVLARLPKTLDETYARILCSIPEDYSEHAIRILQLLACSMHPLQIDEVAEIVAINPEGDPWFDHDARFPEQRDILTICAGFVVEDQDSCLRFAHFSVKEYLLSGRIQDDASKYAIHEIAAHRSMAALCLAYIRQVAEYGPFEYRYFARRYPLTHYAIYQWIEHVKRLGKDFGSIENLIVEFFLAAKTAYRKWARRVEVFLVSEDWEDYGSNVYQAAEPYDDDAFNKLEFSDEDNKDDESDISKELDHDDKDLPSPLYFASYFDAIDLARLLLNNGADVNAQGGIYHTALQKACAENNTELMHFLIEKGADVNAQGGYYHTALQAACTRRGIESVQLLIKEGADVNAQGGKYHTALQAACIYQEIESVQLLIEKGADVNAQGGRYHTALQAACHSGNFEIVQLLIEKGADVNAQGGNYHTALQAACYHGTFETVQLLIEKGADVNAQGGKYHTALHAASYSGNKVVAEILLNNGANVTESGQLRVWCKRNYVHVSGSALLVASLMSHTAIAKLLLDYGADVNAVGELDGVIKTTPLKVTDNRELVTLFQSAQESRGKQSLEDET